MTFVTYAQNREDAILAAYFKDVQTGTYVDIGAHHPVADSVTKHFYERGWRGVNVEPNPELFALIQQDRPEDSNIQAGISNKKGSLKLRIYNNTGLSTFSETIQDIYKHTVSDRTKDYQDVEVPVLSLVDLFESQALQHIHFMKVDVEGYEYEVLQGNDWKRFRPEMICIEADHKIKDWRPILEKADYSFVWNDGLNDYYLAKESKYREAYFEYPETMLLQDQILPYHVVERINEFVTDAEQQEVKNQIMHIKVDQLESANKELEDQIREQRRIKNAAKLLIIGIDKAIQTHINAVRVSPKSQASHSFTHAPISINGRPVAEVLQELQNADMRTYYARALRGSRKSYVRIGAYHTLRLAYFTPRRAAIKLQRLVRGKRDGDE